MGPEQCCFSLFLEFVNEVNAEYVGMCLHESVCSPQVFERLLDAGQTDLVRDWVMLSLSNFTQRTPVAMAIWSLTCFFISASTNSWLRALYPFQRVIFEFSFLRLWRSKKSSLQFYSCRWSKKTILCDLKT